MWKKLLITGCVTFSLLSGGTLSAQPSCEIKEEVTSEQLDRTQKELVAMMKELKNVFFSHFFLMAKTLIIKENTRKIN